MKKTHRVMNAEQRAALADNLRDRAESQPGLTSEQRENANLMANNLDAVNRMNESLAKK